MDGASVTFDTLGWIDLQADTSGNVTNLLITAFETPTSASATGCDYIEGMIAGTETQFDNGWYFEQLNLSDSSGVGAGTYSIVTGEAIALNLSGGAENGIAELTGSVTVSSMSTSALSLSSVSLSDGSYSVSGSSLTICTCPNLDPSWLQTLVTQ